MFNYIMGQVFTTVGYLTYYASRGAKTKEKMVAVEAASKVFLVISFLFLGQLPGLISNILTTIRSVIVYQKEKKQKKYIGAYIVILVACLVSGFFSYKNIFSLCIYIATIISTTATWFCNPQALRKWCIVGAIFYLIYQVSIVNIMGIVFEVGSLASSGISFLVYHKKEKEKQ